MEFVLTNEHVNALSEIESAKFLSGNETQPDGTESYFAVFERVGINTCVITVKPAVYAIFACEYIDGDFTIFKPDDDCLYQCSVSETVRISIKKVPVSSKGLLDKIKAFGKPVQPEQRYCSVTLPEMPNYADDLLCYSYDGVGLNCKFPITAQMLNKTVLIPEFEGNQPRIESLDSKAYKVVIQED